MVGDAHPTKIALLQGVQDVIGGRLVFPYDRDCQPNAPPSFRLTRFHQRALTWLLQKDSGGCC